MAAPQPSQSHGPTFLSQFDMLFEFQPTSHLSYCLRRRIELAMQQLQKQLSGHLEGTALNPR
jgi:hypothetical protein